MNKTIYTFLFKGITNMGKELLLTSTVVFFFFFSFSQTLVNLKQMDTLGHPTIVLDLFVVDKDHDKGTGIVVAVMNRYVTGEEENYYIFAYQSSDSTMLWDAEFNSLTNARDFGTDVFIKDDFVYVTGFSWDSANNSAEWNTMKLELETGNVEWTASHQSSYNGLDGPAAVIADDDGNVYVCGLEQSGALDTKMSLVKYKDNGNEMWYSVYDSIGKIDGAVGMHLDGNKIFVYGFSGTTFSSWDFVAALFNSDDGTLDDVEHSPNGNGAFSSPAGLVKDDYDHFYLAGTSAGAGMNTDFKLIKYDSLLTEVWVRTWGDSLLPNVCTALERDNNGNLILTGHSTNAQGGKELVVLKYDQNGTLLWDRKISAASNHNAAKGRDLAVDEHNNIYVTGQTFNGMNNDILVASFDPSGNMRWLKTYTRNETTDEKGLAVVAMGNTVFVSGASYGTDSVYVLLQYQQKTFTNTLVVDTDSVPTHVRRQLIIRFDTSALKTNAIDNEDIIYGLTNTFVKDSIANLINAKMPEIDFLKSYLIKLAPMYHTWDTTLVSTLGDTIKIPPFYASFLLVYNQGSNTEQYYADTLEKISKQIIKWVDLNSIMFPHCDCSDYCATDPFYGGQFGQTGLQVINIEPAWVIETGKPFIKVGIFDSGINHRHEDFNADGTSVVLGGRDYTTGGFPDITQYSDPDWDLTLGHGTACAGIISALRSNDIGIAGVAGGRFCTDSLTLFKQTGVSLHAFRVSMYHGPSNGGIFPTAYVVNAMNDLLHNHIDIAITNHSYGGTLDLDTQFLELKEKFYTAFRQGKISVASRGNFSTNVHNAPEYPACFNDDWMLNISGSASDGTLWNSNYGHGVDVLAPRWAYTTVAAYTDHYNSNFAGTSASAPYVSGLAALLLSYMNDPSGQPGSFRLAPEDVEEIIQRTAWNYVLWGYYDQTSAWGEIDAGAALDMVNKTKSRLLHFSNNINTTHTYTKISGSDITLIIPETTYEADAGTYKAEVWMQTSVVNHNIILQAGETIENFWARSSGGTNTFPLYDSTGGVYKLDPHVKCYLDTADENTATLRGYYYVLKDSQSNFISVIPSGNNTGSSIVAPFPMQYTIHTRFEPITAIRDEKKDSEYSVSLYPNPTANSFHLSVRSETEEQFAVKIFDNLGRLIDEPYSGKTKEISKDINTAYFSNGVYVVRITSETINRSLKLVIQK